MRWEPCAASAIGTRRRSMATFRCEAPGPGLRPLAKRPGPYHLRTFMHPDPSSCRPSLRRTGAAALMATALVHGALQAQAAIDPNVAPRAAALEREGERQAPIGLLRRYLATAPDDGRAWFQLGRFYLYDAREWHLHGHRGDPDGLLYLDFAATALDQSVRLSVDSGVVFRGLAELERSIVFVEDSGWDAGRYARVRSG